MSRHAEKSSSAAISRTMDDMLTFDRARPIALLLVLAAGCASTPPPDPWYPRSLGPTETHASEEERSALDRLDELPYEGELAVGELRVFAEAPYHAASDRRCRRLRLTSTEGGTSNRLACESPDGWRFAADVFGGPEAR